MLYDEACLGWDGNLAKELPALVVGVDQEGIGVPEWCWESAQALVLRGLGVIAETLV